MQLDNQQSCIRYTDGVAYIRVSGVQSRGRYVQDMTISFSFHLFKTTKGQMAIDMLIVRQSMMRLIPTMN